MLGDEFKEFLSVGDDRDVGASCNEHHVGSSISTWEGDYEVGLGFLEHLTVADWTS